MHAVIHSSHPPIERQKDELNGSKRTGERGYTAILLDPTRLALPL